ncbi:hypothetical protein [Rhodococcus sp. IEGM 1379]|uniref:hypothetical protein n=1 Tax=Rhodococcus sp. IEGM 1379 TaxID=3047086 RepID=UPI0024B6372A|nr:hypothetical protein [Rhodococcus sp. IEGM 1379]MDI9914376.1 hypothetical protein [Rhodococcus sp. IEGM 1379]
MSEGLRDPRSDDPADWARHIPDGEPMLYGRDFAFAEVLAEANLKITATRWLPSEPIPYDEMRGLCGLPDFPDLRAASFFGDVASNPWTIFRSPGDPFVTWTNPFLPNAPAARAEAVKQFVYDQLCDSGVLPTWALPDNPFDEDNWTVQVGEPEPDTRTPQQRALPRPATTPPPWAHNPAKQHRDTRSSRRVK